MLFVCTACSHEWSVEPTDGGGISSQEEEDDDNVIRDVNGAVLEKGDAVLLVKDLGKGLKKGLKVNRIRIGNFGDGHDVEASIPGLGTYVLKSQFLKKV